MGKMLLAWAMAFAVFATPGFSQDEELVKGVELYQQGRFSEAVDVLKTFLEATPDHWAALNYLGGSLKSLGKEKEALSVFTTKARGRHEFKKDYDKNVTFSKQPKAPYTDKARRNRIEGSVIVKVEFKADGTVGFVVPVSTLPDGLTESALDAARRIVFKPAEKNSKPVSVIRTVHYGFALGKRP